jgi:hypothetical protein
MGLVTTLVLLGMAAVVLHVLRLPDRCHAGRLNAELASMIDSGTAELVQEQLRVGPQMVRVRTGRRLGGPFLDIVLDSRRVHLRLYRDARTPAVAGEACARLMVLRRVDELGWVAVFDGPRGHQRYLGWLVESTRA